MCVEHPRTAQIEPTQSIRTSKPTRSATVWGVGDLSIKSDWTFLDRQGAKEATGVKIGWCASVAITGQLTRTSENRDSFTVQANNGQIRGTACFTQVRTEECELGPRDCCYRFKNETEAITKLNAGDNQNPMCIMLYECIWFRWWASSETGLKERSDSDWHERGGGADNVACLTQSEQERFVNWWNRKGCEF
jgi:hypothetical protein